MLTNLVSSAAFAVLTVRLIEAWLDRQEERRKTEVRRAEQERLTVVRSAAYNAVARAPFAQSQIMAADCSSASTGHRRASVRQDNGSA